MTAHYDTIGEGYKTGRATDPEIFGAINQALAGAYSIINIGAGTGSYEPIDAQLIAIEPSIKMIQQRANNSHPTIQASAENLPFKDLAFSHSMTILSMHHWSDRQSAFREIKRVTREKFVALTWDPNADPFWLSRDYFPEIHSIDQAIFPSMDELTVAFPSARILPLPIPRNCKDGFLAAYWARPAAYLNPQVRSSISTFSKIENIEDGLQKLENDLKSGLWERNNHPDINQKHLDTGYRLVIWEV